VTKSAQIVIVISFAGCGGGAVTGSQPAAVSHEATVVSGVRVYAYAGMELEALYCEDGGRLAVDTCPWPATFTLPITPPVELVRRDFDRTMLDDEIVKVHGYGAPPRVGAQAVVLVIESASGVTALAAPLTDGVGPDAQPLPTAWPTSVVDGSQVARLAQPRAEGGGRKAVPALVVDVDGEARTVDVASYDAPVPYAALDLDRDGAPEVIYLAADDGGGFVQAVEVERDDEAESFHARIQ
jgi:hypothetical protein